MTEKSYGGNNGVREHTNKAVKPKNNSKNINKKSIKPKSQKSTEALSSQNSDINDKSTNSNENLNELDSYKKAGEISVKIREYARSIIKPGMKLVDIAKKIENEIEKLGAGVGFPVNLSIDEVAAHYHPDLGDETVASGLLKVDIGIHINGFIADSAFSLDLTPDKKYKDLIKASEEALESALDLLDKNPSLNDIGNAIQESIQKKGFSPIVNLSGHGLAQYDIHAGITIPNYSNNNKNKLEPGAYAVEPFATTGQGKVVDGKSSNIYSIVNVKNVRGTTARNILEYALEKYNTLPFSLREMQEKFGPMARLGLKELEQNGIVHNYPQLIEISHHPVSQAEHSFIKTPEGKIIIFTK
jgi:methionyl aminopeptidase